MNSIKILLAGAMIVLVSNLLSGCTSANVSDLGVDRIKSAREMQKTVQLSLVEIEGESDVNLKLVLLNPKLKNLTSVQAWLAYNPVVLSGVKIDTGSSDFELTAPYKNDFDPDTGLIKLGRSNPTPVLKDEALVAELHFDRVGEGAVILEAYDYRFDLQGHTSANMMFDGAPLNILLKPESPLLAIE